MEVKQYIRVSLTAPDDQHGAMIALLSGLGYSGFEEKPGQLEAFIDAAEYDERATEKMLEEYFPESAAIDEKETIEDRDWNAEWEAGFEGVKVGNFCEVLPPFKEKTPGMAYHVLVAPKRAFGTGHHATTRGMIRLMQGLDVSGKRVLDMGCGTGVLGILAHKMGAKSVLCVDIDEWAEENTRENCALNQINNIEVITGDAGVLADRRFDIIFANINRNVLLTDGTVYAAHLEPGGHLLLSGFYDFDEKDVEDYYLGLGLKPLERGEEQAWIARSWVKSDKNKDRL